MAEVVKFVIEDMDVLAKKVAKIIMEEMKPEPLADNTTFTPEEAAEYLRCSRETVYRMVRRKEVPSFKIGQRSYIHKQKLDEWTANGGSGSKGNK